MEGLVPVVALVTCGPLNPRPRRSASLTIHRPAPGPPTSSELASSACLGTLRDPIRFGAPPTPRTSPARRPRLAALIIAAALATACSDRSDPVLHLQANGSLRVQPSSIVIDDGGALDLSAVVRDASGGRVEALPSGATIQWTVVGTNVARIEGSGLSARVSGLKPGRTTLRAALGSLIATASIDVAPVPTRLEKQGPDVVLGLSGELAPHPARVQVIDRHGSPVADVPVSFTVITGGGTITRARAVSDAFGFAETPWILGPELGLQTVEATLAGASPTQLFSYVNGDLASATLSATSSGGSVGTVGQALPELLEIRARDAQGRPVLGVGVEWVASAGVLLPTSPVTDVQGRARARWILGPDPGLQTASARLIRPQPFTGPASGASGEVAITFQAEAAHGSPATLSVAPRRVVLSLGNAARLSVLLQDALGNAMPGPYAASWSLLESDLVALETHATGDAIVLGVRAGQTRAVVTVGALTDTVDVIVQGGSGSGGGGDGPGPLSSLLLTPDTLFLKTGDFGGLNATARDVSGRLLANSGVEWSVDDPSVATVDAFGRVSAQREGTTRVVGLLDGITASAIIVVTKTEVPTPGGGVPQGTNDLRVTGATTTSIDLAFTLGHDGLGNPAYHEIRYAPTPMGWGWGQATRHVSGECASPFYEDTLGARADCRISGLEPGRSYDFRLVSWRFEGPEYVFSPLSNIATGATDEPQGDPGITIDRVIVSPSTGSIEPDESIDLSALALTTSGSPVDNAVFAWTSTNDAVATVDGSGRVTGVSEGAVTIRASASGRVGSASISVSSGGTQPGAVQSISVNPPSSNLTPGASVQLQASAFDNAGTQLSGVSFTWSSDAPSIASVDPSGRVTGHAGGSATISASAVGITGSASVSVQPTDGGGGPGPVAAISISPGSATLSIGSGVQLTASARDASGTLIPGVNLSWSSSNSGVASVNGAGWVTGIGAGSVTITASASCCGVSGNAQITVNSPVPPPPPPSGLWQEQTWNFPDQQTMHSTPGLEAAGNAGGLGASRPVTLPAPGPWGGSRALENYFGTIPADWQPQVATNWYFPNTERELWLETWIRFAPEWSMAPMNPTYPPNGNVDHKTIFLWEEGWVQRWEVKFGPNYFSDTGQPQGGDCVASAASHDVSYRYLDVNGQRCKADRDVWDGQWHRFRIHVRMGSGDGRMRVWWDNQLAVDINGLDTRSGSRRFMGITFGGNRNQGTNHPMSFFYGPARLYRADPGW